MLIYITLHRTNCFNWKLEDLLKLQAIPVSPTIILYWEYFNKKYIKQLIIDFVLHQVSSILSVSNLKHLESERIKLNKTHEFYWAKLSSGQYSTSGYH